MLEGRADRAGGGGMNLNSILIGSEAPQTLADYYTKLFGKPGWEDGGYTGWQIWTIETADVKGDFEKLKAAGATVIQEPYNPGEGESEVWIATFSDPDSNYFQLVSPM